MSRRESSSILLLAALLLAAAGLWYVAAPERLPQPGRSQDAAAEPPDEVKAPPPFLVGSSATRPAAKPSGSSTPPAAPDPVAAPPPAPAGATRPSAAGLTSRAVLGPLFAVAPGSVKDRIVGEARAPLVLPRSHLVGRVGRYGVRETSASAGVFDWNGVARLERETPAPSEAEDDTKEPVTTAVRGVVQAEDGSPIVGAEVILYSSFYLRQAYYDHRVRQIGRVFTDADGVFDMRPIDLDTVHFGADGNVLVTVRHAHHPHLVAQLLPGIVPGRESDVGSLVLPTKPARVFGVVSDLRGRPVEGAAVRASGAMNPVDYDKTERMVVLGACPTATTDADGRYDLTGFAGGLHEISIHVNIDCVLHVRGTWTGERAWSPRVLAGNGIRGRVVDPDGAPVAAAIVAGGGNWTPTNADGTFWLDNIQPGPLTLEIAHHLWRTVFVPDIETDAEENEAEPELTLQERLPRVTLEVVDAAAAPVALVAIDWVWPAGQGPGRFAPDSRYWHDPRGVFALIVPEGVTGAVLSTSDGSAKTTLAPEDLTDGARLHAALAPP